MSPLLSRRPSAGSPRAGEAVFEQLWARRYPSRRAELRASYPRVSDEQIHDACQDAALEIRASGRHERYTTLTEVEFVRRSEFRLLDSMKRERRRQARAPEVEFDEETVTASIGGGADVLSESLRHVASIGRLRELVLGLKPVEAQFWWLTHGMGLTRDEAAEAMGISVDRARRLVTSVKKHLTTYALGEGRACSEFEELVRARLEDSGRHAALSDARVQAHLAYCEKGCAENLRRLETDFKLVAPLLPFCAAAKVGVLAGLLGGGAVAAGGGGGAAAAGGGGLLSGLTAGKALFAAVVIGAGGTTAVVVEHHQAPSRPHRRVEVRAAQRPVAAVSAPAVPARSTAPVTTTAALTRTSATAAGTSADRAHRRQAATASRRETERRGDLAGASVPTGTVPRPASPAPPAATSGAADQSFGLGSGGSSAAAAAPSSSSLPAPRGASAAGTCSPGVLGC